MFSGLAAGAWLGGAEAPTKLVTVGLSPYVISLAMVAGVFVARWTLPTVLKGTGYVFLDLRARAHLVIWAILAGALWAVANTLTVFAIRDVGLSVAFPLWNINSLVGLFWGWFLFNELRGAGASQLMKVLGGAFAIVVGACVLAYATSQQNRGAASRSGRHPGGAGRGTALGNDVHSLSQGLHQRHEPALLRDGFYSRRTLYHVGSGTGFSRWPCATPQGTRPARPVLFWLFLGGFCWVLGDLFQQYAAKYIGIGRGIPLSNTNQLWGLAWGALVFGELSGKGGTTQGLIIAGSIMMIAGAVAISLAEAPASEQESWRASQRREWERYQLDPSPPEAAAPGEDPVAKQGVTRHWWDVPIVVAAVGVFLVLARGARRPPMAINLSWTVLLALAMLGFLVACGRVLWKRTRFS